MTISRSALTPVGFSEDGAHLRYRCVSRGVSYSGFGHQPTNWKHRNDPWHRGIDYDRNSLSPTSPSPEPASPGSEPDSSSHGPSSSSQGLPSSAKYEPMTERGWIALPTALLVGGQTHPPSRAIASEPRNARKSNRGNVLVSSSSNPQSETSNGTSLIVRGQSQQQVINEAPVTTGTHILTHLPRLRKGEETYVSLLPCEEQDEWVRMVWNKSAQDTYSIYDYQSPHVPSIISRRQGTIQLASQDRAAKRLRLSNEAAVKPHEEGNIGGTN